MRKVLPLLAGILLAGCATAQSGEALRTTFDSGVAAYDAGDYPKAYQIWSTIQDEDISAMVNMAKMLREGTGVAKDPKKAEQLYERAAPVSAIAAGALGDMLLKGEAGPPDPQSALPLLAVAANAENPIAQFDLGQMYETGGAVPKDPGTARKLYAAAAGHGMKEAKERLERLGPDTPLRPSDPGTWTPAPPARP